VDILFALALAAVLGALTLSALQGIQLATAWLAAAVTAFGVLHCSVAFRRRAPVAAYGMASLAMLVVVSVPNSHAIGASGKAAEVPMLFMPSSLVFLLILYAVASQPHQRRRTLALLAALAGAVLAALRAGNALEQVYPGGWLVFGYVAASLMIIVAATWSLGSFQLIRRQRAEAERVEAARLAVLEERSRIARDMHDIVAHSLAVIVRQAEGGAFAAAQAPEQAAQALRVIANAGRGALDDMRGLLRVLRSTDGENAAAAAPPSLADLPGLLDRAHDAGLDAEWVRQGTPFEVGAATELAAYRVVQEALTNAIKYAGPHARVLVRLEWSGDGLAVEVTDDGGSAETGRACPGSSGAGASEAGSPDPCSSDADSYPGGPHPPVPGAGAGLQGLWERVAAAGGVFTARRLATGFQVRATFPRRRDEGAR
jgi:signal transduction histidine kinase